MSNARDKANIPALNFSSTGIDDNATSTAITIDSSENVGIGTASPGRIFEVSADQSYVSIKSTNDSTGTSQIFFGDTADDNVGRINYQHSDNSMLFLTSATEVMRIDSSGRVIIGGTTPDTSAKLTLEGGDLRFNTDDKGILWGNNEIKGNNASDFINIVTAGTERMRINSSGQVGLGTSNPGFPLEIVASGQTTVLHLNSTAGTTSAITFANTGSNDSITIGAENDDLKLRTDDGVIKFFTNENSEKMRITSAGKVLINTTVSDNGNVTSSGDGTSGNGACYGLVRSSFRATLGMTSVGDMSIRNYSGEIYVQDSANNITTISPHNFSVIPDGVSEDLAWSYYARKGDTENDFDNTKYISADITKVIRKVENLTGEKLIYSGTGSTDDGSTVSQNIIQDLITRIESLEAEVTALKNQP